MAYSKIMHVDSESCTGCKMCEMACSLAHIKKAINPKRSRIRIIEDTEKGLFDPKVCRICKDPSCIENCPEDALSRDDSTGVIIVNRQSCTSCGLCVDSCEYDAISIDPIDDIPIICDLCGGDPKCVKYCLQEAIVYGSHPKKSLEVKGLQTEGKEE